MTVTYKKLVDVYLLHDYYWPPANLNGPTPTDYNILDDVEILVPQECAQSLRNNKILLRTSRSGFQLLIQAEKKAADWASIINVDPHTKWTFYLRIKKPNWHNFSNLRIQKFSPFPEARSMVYYFSNLTGKAILPQLYLSGGLPTFPGLYSGETKYQLGDLIIKDNKVIEATQNEIDPGAVFDGNQWQDVNATEVYYVNPNNRMVAQGLNFTYTRPNTLPGEAIIFSLKDNEQNSVDLGNIPGTTIPQGSYTAPANAADSVQHTLTFQGMPTGIYTLNITAPSTQETDRVFYLLDPFQYQNIFGIVEVFVGQVPTDFALFDFTDPAKTVIKEKVYQIRFKNRMTQWEYLKKDKSVLTTTGYRPLSKHYSRFVFNTKSQPDPDVARIIPELDASNNISKIKSIIYLNE